MDSRRSFRYAIVDFDETLYEGTLAKELAKVLLDPRKNRGLVPRSYYLKLFKYGDIVILSKLKRFYRIYRLLLKRAYSLYLSILADPKINKEELFSKIREVISQLEIPKVSIAFLEKLKERGYYVVLLTAIPQEIAVLLKDRLPVDEVIGSRPGLLLDREGKEKIIRDLSRRGSVDIIVGNYGYEPFWLAEKLAIMVRSPRDLSRWIERI